MEDVGAARQPGELTGKASDGAATSARMLDLLVEVARVAASTLFGVASVIGVVEVAARQCAVAKANEWTEISQGN
jgi:hypothetical protein